MRVAALCLIPCFLLAQNAISPKLWGLSQSDVLKSHKDLPVNRTSHSLTFRSIEAGIPARQIYEFTEDELDQLSYVADVPGKAAETAYLKWCLAMTNQFGKGEVFFNKKQVGRPGVVLQGVLDQFWKDKAGEVVVVYPQTPTTTAGVSIAMINGQPMVEMDYAKTPASSTAF